MQISSRKRLHHLSDMFFGRQNRKRMRPSTSPHSLVSTQSELCVSRHKRRANQDLFIDKCRSHNLRKKLLESGGTLTLKRAQEIAIDMAAAENRANSQIICGRLVRVLTVVALCEVGAVG